MPYPQHNLLKNVIQVYNFNTISYMVIEKISMKKDKLKLLILPMLHIADKNLFRKTEEAYPNI